MALQVGLALGLLVWLGRVRVPLVLTGKVRVKDVATSREGWPEHVRQLGNAFDNQFQLPVLFYVAVLLTLWAGVATWLEVVLAFVFVALRIAHAYVHGTSNDLRRRFTAFIAGVAVLASYWLVLVAKILSGGAP